MCIYLKIHQSSMDRGFSRASLANGYHILDCAECGGKPCFSIISTIDRNGEIYKEAHENALPFFDLWFLTCGDCGLTPPPCIKESPEDIDTGKGVADAWNNFQIKLEKLAIFEASIGPNKKKRRL